MISVSFFFGVVKEYHKVLDSAPNSSHNFRKLPGILSCELEPDPVPKMSEKDILRIMKLMVEMSKVDRQKRKEGRTRIEMSKKVEDERSSNERDKNRRLKEDETMEKRLSIHKVGAKWNFSDIVTKAVTAETTSRLLAEMGLIVRQRDLKV